MKRTCSWLLTLAGCLAIAWLLPAVSSASDAPSISIPDTGFNFGELSETIPVSHDFTVKNEGKTTLNIKDVQPS